MEPVAISLVMLSLGIFYSPTDFYAQLTDKVFSVTSDKAEIS